jgi:hypothetical protein
MQRIMRRHPIIIGLALGLCAVAARADVSDPDPFINDKSSECQFLAGAWEGYVAGLTASADKDREYKTKVAVWFHRLQRGVAANVYAYENLKREFGDTDEHKAFFLQVEKVARLVDLAFEKRFSKSTRLGTYMGRSKKLEIDDNG